MVTTRLLHKLGGVYVVHVHAALRSSLPNRDSVKLVVSYRKKLRFRDNLGYAITIHLADGMGNWDGPDSRVEKGWECIGADGS